MVDYSKWKDIEISDDEDDTHPNIDTPSLFRWRHQARMERMAEHEKEKNEFLKIKKENEEQLKIVQKKLEEEKKKNLDLTEVKKELRDIENEHAKLKAEEEKINKKEKLMPWNVDTISREGFTKTVINKAPPKQKIELTDEEKEEKQRKFVAENEKLVKQYGMFQKYDDSKRFLMENPHLACEETANYLVMWCIGLEVEEKHELMEHVAHQCICMQYVLELSKQLDVDPRACICSFFTRINIADKEYKDAFEDELRAFKERVRERAKARIERIMQEIEEEEKQKRLGPGGLDPVDVFETLPDVLKKCFEERDIGMLQEAITKLPEEEARYHMKRCVDSGLWIPDAKKGENDQGDNSVASK